MLTYVDGSLFVSPAQVLVNTVNTVGVMGKGIAKEFKAIYPEMFDRYKDLCDRGEFGVGNLLLYKSPHKWVLNFPTKRHWKQKSRLQDIEAGLRKFVQSYEQLGITSIAFPQLGCGNGQLDWESEVRPLMERYLLPLTIDISIHIYGDDWNLSVGDDVTTMRSRLQLDPDSPPFGQVWDELVTLVQSGAAPGWLAVVGEDHRPVGLQWEDGTPVLYREDGFDLWHQLRTVGYLSVQDVPVELGELATAVLDFFQRLGYATPARIFTDPCNVPGAGNATVAELLDQAPVGLRRVLWHEDSKPGGQNGVRVSNGAGQAWAGSRTMTQSHLTLTG